jgi:hypothetical protein
MRNSKFAIYPLRVKLPAHRAGLPGMVYQLYLCPFLPAGRQGTRLSRFGETGHVPVKMFFIPEYMNSQR